MQGWSPLARVGRAYRAGVSHRTILRGDFGRAVSSPSCPIPRASGLRIWALSWHGSRTLRETSRLLQFATPLRAKLSATLTCLVLGGHGHRHCKATMFTGGDPGAGVPDHCYSPIAFSSFCRATKSTARLAQGVLVRVRAGGFLVALPSEDPVVEVMRGLVDGEGESLVLDTVVSVAFETSRGRALGEGPSTWPTFLGKGPLPLPRATLFGGLWLASKGSLASLLAGRLRDPPAAACSERPRLGFRPRWSPPRPPST